MLRLTSVAQKATVLVFVILLSFVVSFAKKAIFEQKLTVNN
jgi:hypothetical protein